MVFTVLGAVAELEQSLIVERVEAGLRNARANGKRLGVLGCQWTRVGLPICAHRAFLAADCEGNGRECRNCLSGR